MPDKLTDWYKKVNFKIFAPHFREGPDHYKKNAPECIQKSPVDKKFANQPVKTVKNLVEKFGLNLLIGFWINFKAVS